MGRRLSGNGGGGGKPKVEAYDVPTTGGVVKILTSLMGSGSTFALLAADSGVTFNAPTGEITATVAAGTNKNLAVLDRGSSGAGYVRQIRLTGVVVVSKPAAPTVTLAAGNGQIFVGWTDNGDGGAAIFAHTIYVDGRLFATIPVAQTSITITGLTNGTAYSVQVSAENSVGEGTKSFGQSATPVNVPFASVDASGWKVTYSAAPPSLQPMVTFNATRKGFDNTGAAKDYTDTLVATQRVRQVYPNQALLTNYSVALSGMICAGDSIAGVANNSTQVMPAPITNWVMQSRRIVGNTLRLGVTGNHWAARDGKPFACVIFTVTDGTNKVTKIVTAMTVSTTGAADQCAVLAYEDDIDVSSLNAGLITANAKVYPWRGSAESVADSSANSGTREFSPRYFIKDTTKVAAPNVVFVATSGNDSTGYVGTDATAAAAAPCATLTGAINRARAVLGTATGSLNGLRVKLTEGTWSLSANPTANTTTAEIVIEPAPGAAKANTIFQFGAANYTPSATYLRYRGLTITRMGAFYLYNGTTGFGIIEDCTFNPNGYTGAMASTAGTMFFYNGVTFTAAPGNIVSAGNNGQAMMRGVTVANNNGAAWEPHLVIGCSLGGCGQSGSGTRSENGQIVQFNKFPSQPAAALWSPGASGSVTNASFSQNGVEIVHATAATAAIRPSADGAVGSLTHVLMDNNTIASGHYQAGRMNVFYDETQGTNRSHAFCRIRNTVAGGAYIKTDWFVGENGNGTPNPTDAPNHIGNWAQVYGVGFKNMVTLLVNPGANAVGGSQGWAYPGQGAAIGSSQTVQSPAVSAWTDWRATTTNPSTGAAVAGAGGGDYSVPAGSPLLGLVAANDEVFPFDLAGVARSRGSVGAYA
jgi:hypothetical protein